MYMYLHIHVNEAESVIHTFVYNLIVHVHITIYGLLFNYI